MLSGTPHFLAVNLVCWKRPECDENSRITVPFSSAKNVTRLLLCGPESGIETSVNSSAEVEQQQARLKRSQEAMLAYKQLLQSPDARL
jgi:hypothetical protein